MGLSNNQAEAIERHILDRAEKKIDEGKNHFLARGLGAGAALTLLTRDKDERQSVITTTNEGIARLLAKRGAEGTVYAIQPDESQPGSETSTDFVVVTARDEKPTRVQKKPLLFEGEQYVTRASTDGLDEVL